MTPYKLQLTQQLQDTDKPARRDFCIAMQKKLEDDGFDVCHVTNGAHIEHL